MTEGLPEKEILAILRELKERVITPLWLFGGVAVDFLVGRWTRPHGDIDLNALSLHRDALACELGALGYRTDDLGWLTHWRDGTGRALEIVFLERTPGGEAELVIREGDAVGKPGRYPMVGGYLDPDRYATLGDVAFRVSNPSGEWLARARSVDLVAGRARSPKLDHDLRLLETVLTSEELARLREIAHRDASRISDSL